MTVRSRTSPAGAWIALVTLLALTFGATLAVSFVFPLASEDEFNVVDWELRNLPGKWLYLGGRLVHGGLSTSEEDARVARYLDLTRRIDRLQKTGTIGPAQATTLRDLERERSDIENDVEAILAGRITEVLADAGLHSSLPLFPDAHWVFPPVAVEFDEPPNELAISPRDHIELVSQRPLRHDLSAQQIADREAAEERGGHRSALIEPVSGVATYPSLVEADWDYQRLLEVVAHEWVHQYLFFHPLGRKFFSGLELRTLNETVATLAGRELSLLVLLKDPLHEPYAHPEPAAAQPNLPDVSAVLRQLRTDVDALLAFGQIDAAEALMEQRRQELADNGILYPRINQAFFAFRNVYATEPGSIDPIGLKLVALRAKTGSTGAFLRAAAQLTSEADLDRALADQPR